MRAIGIILAGGKNEKLHELTKDRALAAMPVAGSYRAVDFALSNMINSGINKVAVVTQYNSRSLIEHFSSSKWWDFGRKHGGLFVFTPSITPDNGLWYRGTADAIYQNIKFLKNTHETYVVISQGDSITKIDYNKVVEHHVNKEADITIIGKRIYETDLTRFGHIKTNVNGRLLEFEEKPLDPDDNLVSAGIYIIRRRLLIELLEESQKEERYNFVNDIIIRQRKRKNISVYIHEGYWKSIASLEAYFNSNMDFLQKDTRDMFFREKPIVLSKVEDEPPAKFNQGTKVVDSLCSSGCILNGNVEHSILFRKVFVGNNSIIKNSIILEGAYIGNHCYIENCIMDSSCRVPDGSVYHGDSAESPLIIPNKEEVP